MNCLNCHWLGFAANQGEAIRIIQGSGIFYLLISVGYLLSLLYMIWHSPPTKKRLKYHIFGIVIWATFGVCLVAQPVIFSLIFNGLILLLAIVVLYQLQFTSPLLAQANLSFQTAKTDDKKAMYANTLLTKMNCTISDVLSYTIINEQILWILIFYRAAIGFRAGFEL